MDSGPSSIPLELLLIFILVLFNAFFAASQIALMSADKNKLNAFAEQGNENAKLLLKLLQEPSRFLTTMQVGITLAGFLASASAAISISTHFVIIFKKWNVPFAFEITIVIMTLLLSFITLVFGELFPKRVAMQKPEEFALFSIKPIIFMSKITFPFVKLLTLSINALVRLFKMDSENLKKKVSEEEIRSLIEVGEENGVINRIEKNMLDGIFKFDDTVAKEIMTPRINVFAIDIDQNVEELIDKISEERYSRIPVFENDIDNIIGVLYMRDIFRNMRKKTLDSTSIRKLLRPAYFIPETKNIDTLFNELQRTKNHMALLIDEYGGFSGIVTIEDMVEEVMGNIFDEYDNADDEINIKKIDDDTYLVSGLASIDEFNENFNLNLESENYDTIGGFVLDLLGTFPKDDIDQTVEYENIIFKIEKVNDKRIEEIKVYFSNDSQFSYV